MEVAERIRANGSNLTVAERRVAEAILAAPQAVGFGTVAELAATAHVGAASVVRLASKLGFDGYSELQACIQRDLTSQLRPAAERIQEAGSGRRSEHAVTEAANARRTIEAATDEALAAVVARLADRSRPVAVLTGDASLGVAQQFVSQLHQLRAGVAIITGNDVAVRREIALLPEEATLLVIDFRRYERWVLEAHTIAHGRGIWSAGLTDSLLSPIAALAEEHFVVSGGSVGPFDSHVGTLALLDLLAADTATALRDSASERLAAVEVAWSEGGSLTDDHSPSG